MTDSPPTGELVARLLAASAIFDDIRAIHANAEDGDCEPHWSLQGEAEEARALASEAADAITTLERELEEARKKAGKLHDYANMRDWQVTDMRAALMPFAQEKMPSLKMTEIAYNSFGLRCLMSPMAIARQKAIAALRDGPSPAEAALTASQAEVEKLKEALKPFAEAADSIDDTEGDRIEMWEHPASMQVTAADFRRASDALQSHDKDREHEDGR